MSRFLIVSCILLAAFYVAFGGNIWASVPGATDDAKMNNIIEGVRRARLQFYSDICTHSAWITNAPGIVDDFPTNQNWGGFLCSFWGGPIAAHPNCTYYYQNLRLPENIVNDSSTLVAIFQSAHSAIASSLGVSFSNAQFNVTMIKIANSIASIGGAPGFSTTAINDMDTGLRAAIVTNSSAAGTSCPTANLTIGWLNPYTGNFKTYVGEYVSWVWSDDAQHSVESTTVGLNFVGMGSGPLTLSRTNACLTSNNGCTSSVGSFVYSWKFTVAGNYTFRCNVHQTTMNGTLSVTFPNATSDGTGIGFSGSSSVASSGSVLSSWFSYLF